MLELNCEINALAGEKQGSAYIWTSCFSFMFFGHIIDNVRHTKKLFVSLELISCVWFIIMGYSFITDFKDDHGILDPDDVTWS
jgi:hypothetical protein